MSFLSHVVSSKGVSVKPAKIEVVTSLNLLQSVKFIPVCESSFQELKQKLVTTSVLIVLDGSESFVIYSDASRQQGCDFMQQCKVVAYVSCQLKSHE
ncbi:ty3-gypsy retrotransposon protein [Cucumis melo var. makuwa]|uniref:Ty3-gypsy retrotransposon protein n=1 Tax=Cucumis melo var. makuwa TaxID=1194695 RepID=A0A5A7V8U6_CUCMM|nr:ty3-gypsy retrotransposon protein [Cucumis melo var. makuwa]